MFWARSAAGPPASRASRKARAGALMGRLFAWVRSNGPRDRPGHRVANRRPGLADRLLARAYRLDVVAVRIEQERGVIIAASRSWKILRFPFAARRKLRGGTPAARWKVRTKFERSPNPTSRAMSVMERTSCANNRAARRNRERIRY